MSFNLGGGNASADQQSEDNGGSDANQSGEETEIVADGETETPRRRACDGVIDVEV